MATLYFDTKIRDITINNGIFGSRHYSSCFSERWEEAKSILSEYGITLSDYEIIFEGSEYQIQAIPGHFGSRSGKVFYKDILIAKGSISGSNYCDREANLEFDLGRLKTEYKKE